LVGLKFLLINKISFLRETKVKDQKEINGSNLH